MPMMAASTGKFLVSGVSRALEPCTISTNSSWPAPTVSTATKVRRVDAVRLDDEQFVPDHRSGLLRRDDAAGYFGDEHKGVVVVLGLSKVERPILG
jgi:hypothetical protein